MTQPHAAVWLDHNQARIFHVGREAFDEKTIESPSAHTQLHRRSGPGAEAAHRSHGDPRFFRDVAGALADAEAILVVGPANAKHELVCWLHDHARALERKIVGVETMDHPSDGQIVAYVRSYFAAADRMR
jgi:hypothetical protein